MYDIYWDLFKLINFFIGCCFSETQYKDIHTDIISVIEIKWCEIYNFCSRLYDDFWKI